MSDRRLDIDPDVRRARTPPPDLYLDPQVYALQKERVFARTWHFAAADAGLEEPGQALPFLLLPGCLDEPLLLVRDSRSTLHCLSNVCTHRGALIVEQECRLSFLRCRYHGRRWHLDGTFAYMPGFERAENFPNERDWLPRVAVAGWRGLLFASLAPATSPDAMIAAVDRRLAGLAVTDWTLDPASVRDYEVEANWALYVENFLEGFHVPFVHPDLAKTLDVRTYRTELFDVGTLQIAPAAPEQPAFEPPPGSPEHGQRVAAYHFWLFPATMLNVYPWGLSLNAVQPLGVERTRVRYAAFVHDESLRTKGAGGALHQVELEDEAIVASVQRGQRARLYRGGRYSPDHEDGVHHFHRLLAGWMAGGSGA